MNKREFLTSLGSMSAVLALPEVEGVKTLRLGEKDIVVIKCEGCLSRESMSRIQCVWEKVREAAGIKNEAMVLDGGLDVSVLRND